MLQKQALAKQQDLDKKLDSIAITEGCGYKAANLRVLQDISTQINNNNLAYTIAIPEFVAIPSAAIQQFILENTELDIADQWKNIITRSFPTDEIKKETLKSKQYPKDFLSRCATLQEKIKKLPETITPDGLSRLKGVTELAEKIALKTERLMVRSSGKEDTKTLANAGGNASVANVAPDTFSIINALSTVVSSYFSKKSLIQRLGAHDSSLFELNPLTPVIIQRMISSADNNPTKCGVMFTEEAEGGIAKNNRPNNFKTTGITLIQSAYGHNEGVVNSLIPVDTYYATQQNSIFTIIRPKTYYMAPTEESGTLTLKKNNADSANKPALTKEAVTTLKYLATELERTYQCPMDVEFVINEDERKIYIVQARPLVHDPNAPKASYIINPDGLTEQKITGSAIGVAGGALRHCTKPNQLVIASTINQALSQYQDLSGNEKEKVECIIVGTMAPTTSHETTAFRSESKPVLYSNDWQTVEQWIAQPNSTIIISPQQGLLINFTDQAVSIDQLIKDQSASLGWTNYPIERYLSLIHEFDPALLLTAENVCALLPGSVNKDDFIKEAAQQKIPWKQLLDGIKTKSEDSARVALAALLYEIREIIDNKSQGLQLDEDLQNKIKLLESYAMHCAQNIAETLQFEPTDSLYPQRLFAVRFLETLLYQQPLFNEIINGYSITTVVAKELVPEQQIIKKAQEKGISLDNMSVQLIKIKDFAMTPDLENEWSLFVEKLTKLENKDLPKLFLFLIKELSSLNILPLWTNTAFAEKIKKNPSTELLIKSLLAEYSTQKDFLAHIAEKKELMATFNIQAFADPKTFESQWQLFQDNFLTYFLDDNFITEFKNANALGQLTALNTMSQLINTFDLSIKEVTGSISYTNVEEKVKNFHTMLKDYFNLLNTWINLIPKDMQSDLVPYYLNHINKGINGSLYTHIFQRKYDKQQLTSTPNLDVSAFTLGSGATLTFEYPAPTTYEDYFTLIHQCLLVVVSTLNKANGRMKNITLLSLTKQLQDTIENINFTVKIFLGAPQPTKPRFIGIDITDNGIKLLYNLPLRAHSLQITTSQKNNTSNAILSLKFYGMQIKRWERAAALTHILSNQCNAPLIDSTTSEKGSSLTLLISQSTKFEELKKYIESIIDYVTPISLIAFAGTNPNAMQPYAEKIMQNIEQIVDPKIKQDIIKEIKHLIPKTKVTITEEQPLEKPQITSKNLPATTPTLQGGQNWLSRLWSRFFG